jgi:hypothetical protein
LRLHKADADSGPYRKPKEGQEMKSYGLTAAMVGIAALLGAGAASAATINAGKWKVTIDGNINANFVYTECADKTGPAGNLLCSGRSSKALGDKDVAGVSTSLLSSALVIGVSTTQAGYDIGARPPVFINGRRGW